MTEGDNTKLAFLESKNVLVFDTETTGLPERVPSAKWGSASEYWPYNMNEKYRDARIVSIAWAFIKGFKKDADTLAGECIHEYIRYPEGFTEIPTTHIHGITMEHAKENGIPINDIFENCGLAAALEQSDYIIGHNVMFDVHILENELFRLGTDKSMATVRKLETMKSLSRVICTGELGKDICKLEFKSRGGKDTARVKRFKMPKLIELHTHIMGCEHDDQHSAKGDVRALLNCLAKM